MNCSVHCLHSLCFNKFPYSSVHCLYPPPLFFALLFCFFTYIPSALNEDERWWFAGWAGAFFVTCLHHPFTVASWDCHSVPSALAHEHAMTLATYTDATFHREWLALYADGSAGLEVGSPWISAVHHASALCFGDLECGTVTETKKRRMVIYKFTSLLLPLYLYCVF